LKYAGTVITASVTFSPRKSSAACFSFCSTIAEISGGEYCLPRISTHASPVEFCATLYGTAAHFVADLAELATHEPLYRVHGVLGLVTACRFATWPTSRSPSLTKPTTEGVVRAPS
jgi:hypothetical protein